MQAYGMHIRHLHHTHPPSFLRPEKLPGPHLALGKDLIANPPIALCCYTIRDTQREMGCSRADTRRGPRGERMESWSSDEVPLPSPGVSRVAGPGITPRRRLAGGRFELARLTDQSHVTASVWQILSYQALLVDLSYPPLRHS